MCRCWSTRVCTGTSSISCGSSCSRCCTWCEIRAVRERTCVHPLPHGRGSDGPNDPESEIMADTNHGGEHHGPSFQVYMIIAGVLAVCTALSFIVNQTVSVAFIAFLLILSVAIVKAVLVGMYFMHLKWDWKFLYFLIVPVFIMGAMMAT